MTGKTGVKTMAISGVFVLFSLHTAWSGDYSVSVNNSVHKLRNDPPATCTPISLTYWSGSNGAKAQSSETLYYTTPKTLTIKNAGPCSSMDLTVTCRYFQTIFDNYGSSGGWVTETKSQSIPCGNHSASIVLTRNGSLTLLGITSP